MACSMQPPCSCHSTLCVVCDCLHDPCGWLCTTERRLLNLRLRSWGVPAALRRSAVAAQVPEAQSGIQVVDHRFVRTAHARGLQVHVWTVNEPDRMHRLLDLGVDGIMTDHIDTLRKVMEDRGVWV